MFEFRLTFFLAAAKLSKRYTNHCVRTTALEQFSTSRRARQAAGTPTVQAAVNTLQQQQQPQTSPSQSPSRSPVQSPGSMSSGINSNRSSPTLARSPTMQDYKCGIQQVIFTSKQFLQAVFSQLGPCRFSAVTVLYMTYLIKHVI